MTQKLSVVLKFGHGYAEPKADIFMPVTSTVSYVLTVTST